MDYPKKYYYTEEHEWADFDKDQNEATIGITDFAQSELGDIVFLELPEKGEEVHAGDAMGTIEAVKTVADLFSPVTGKIAEVNPALDDSPVSDATEFDALLSLEDYKKLVD